MGKRILISIAVVIGVGIVLGIWWSQRPSEMDTAPLPSSDTDQLFGEYFALFFIGRPGEQTTIRANTPLLRSSTFIAGERAGLRVQTTASVTSNVPVEIRFLSGDTREETPELRAYRSSFSIRPGLRSYCCVNIPKIPGRISAGVLINGSYVGYIHNLTIKLPQFEERERTFGQ